MCDSVIPDCFRTASRIGPEYASVIPAAYRLEASVARRSAQGVIPDAGSGLEPSHPELTTQTRARS